MKNTYRFLQSAVALAAVAFASSASATTLTLKKNIYSGQNGLGGGEFTATSATLSNASYSALAVGAVGGVATFCMEFNEHFAPGAVYDYTISSFATAGSGGAIAGKDPVSAGTAWLYSQFATGSLANYNYTNTSGRVVSNQDLQLAFWFFEDETAQIGGAYASYGVASNNVFLNAAVAQFGSVAGAKADANGMFGVSVLNLTSSNGTVQNQSQLYFTGIPTGVPDQGSTAALLGLSLIGLVGFSRRKFSR